MSKYNDLIDDRGFIKPEAQKFLQERFEKEVDILLEFGANENELRTINSILNNIVSSKTLNKIVGLK